MKLLDSSKNHIGILGLFYFILFMFAISCSSCAQGSDYTELRRQMVNTQLEARGISDQRVLNAFLKVERHRFVLSHCISKAYNDYPLPIEEGQTISQPYIVAFMTDLLSLKSDDRVLEIGTGSGYQAAILAEICDSVFTIEIFPELGRKAIDLFSELGYKNIFCKIGDGYKGWTEKAPFDAIIVTCAPSKIPEPLKEQLAEGGRMIIPVGSYPFQTLVLLEKRKGKIREKDVLSVRFVPMLNEDGKSY